MFGDEDLNTFWFQSNESCSFAQFLRASVINHFVGMTPWCHDDLTHWLPTRHSSPALLLLSREAQWTKLINVNDAFCCLCLPFESVAPFHWSAADFWMPKYSFFGAAGARFIIKMTACCVKFAPSCWETRMYKRIFPEQRNVSWFENWFENWNENSEKESRCRVQNDQTRKSLGWIISGCILNIQEDPPTFNETFRCCRKVVSSLWLFLSFLITSEYTTWSPLQFDRALGPSMLRMMLPQGVFYLRDTGAWQQALSIQKKYQVGKVFTLAPTPPYGASMSLIAR